MRSVIPVVVALLPLGAVSAQDIALPSVFRGTPEFYEPTIAAGELVARELGFPSLDAVAPTCPELTVAAMAADDAGARASGQKVTPWRTKGRPEEIWKDWGDEVVMSCRVAAADKLIAESREWTERPAPPWRAVWDAVLDPIGAAPYWSRRRSGTVTNFCDSTERQGFCVTENLSYHRDIPERERNRIALQIAADIGLDDAQAEALNAFALQTLLRGGVIHREFVGERFCDRLQLLETPAAMGRALNVSEELRQTQEAELFRAIWQVLDAETVERIHRYAVAQLPVLREVDHEAWFSKFSPEVVEHFADVRCALGIPQPGVPSFEESLRENGGWVRPRSIAKDEGSRSRRARDAR